MENLYQELADVDTREEYLDDLADQYGVDLEMVKVLADVLGPEEDFDGLVTMIQDYDPGLYSQGRGLVGGICGL